MITVIPLLLFGIASALEGAAPPGYYPVESYPVEESRVRERCTVGARRRFDYTQCSSYEECVADGKNVKWEAKKCADGYAFNDSNGNCQIDEKCATVEEKCTIPYFRLSCSELLVCAQHNGAYIRTNCDDGFRNELHGGCIEDARCTTKYKNETCKSGQARPTSNCRTYSICEGGNWRRETCLKGGRWSEFCSECDPEYKPRECKEGDTKPINHTESFEGYGIDTSEIIDCGSYQVCDQGRWSPRKCDNGKGYDPSAKRCTPSRLHDAECNPPVCAPRCEEGSRIFPPHACSRFLQCDRGEWRQMSCPIGSRFNPHTNRCVEGNCKQKHHHTAEDKESANYRREHSQPRSFEESGSEEEEIDFNDARFFQQQPVMIPAAFPAPQRRLNGAPEPFGAVPSQLSAPHQIQQQHQSHHRPGYLGHPESPVAVVGPHHHHHQRPQQPTYPARPQPPYHPEHHHQQPYRPQPPQYPPAPVYAPAVQPVQPVQPVYPVQPVQPVPAVYEEGVQPPRLPGLICEGDFKVADAFDSGYYYDCVRGYLKRKACPRGSRFDPQRSKCLSDYSWKPDVICYDNQVMPTAYCGEYRICRNNEWLSGNCPHDWPFINGQCDKRKTCRDIAAPPPLPPTPACAPGSVRPDFANSHGYLECDYGYRWVKRSCQNGEVFDKRMSRCAYAAPSYPAANPPAYAPQPAPAVSAAQYHSVCYEGEMKKDEQYCTKYEICHDGKFEQRYCPYGSGFNGYHCEQGHRCAGDSGVAGTCQESAGLRGFLPDRTDCGFFYQCAQGRWIRMPCGVGTHYNPQIGVCDHIGNVPGCGWNGPRPTHY